MRNYKTISLKKKTHEELKFVSDCLDRSMMSVLRELITEVFQLFNSYNPKNKDARVFYDLHSGYLTVTTSGKSNILFGEAKVQHNASITEEDRAVREKIEPVLNQERDD